MICFKKNDWTVDLNIKKDGSWLLTTTDRSLFDDLRYEHGCDDPDDLSDKDFKHYMQEETQRGQTLEELAKILESDFSLRLVDGALKWIPDLDNEENPNG